MLHFSWIRVVARAPSFSDRYFAIEMVEILVVTLRHLCTYRKLNTVTH